MAIPDFQTIMLPLLKIVGDGKEHQRSNVVEALASEFRLTDDEKEELLPSGTQPKFYSRVGWAMTYMKKALLLESTGRGSFRITEQGSKVLQGNPSKVDVDFLMQFPEFVVFRKKTSPTKVEKGDAAEEETSQTPREVLESSYQSLRSQLAQDILETVLGCSPGFFERIVVDLLLAMGYGGSKKDAGQAIGKTGDGGIDGIIKEDKLGLDVVCIQAKRWEGTVGRPVVQAFVGSLMGRGAKKGIMITTSQFSKEAQQYANSMNELKIVLIDGERLAQLMIDYNVGVAERESFVIKEIDTDYFEGDF